MDDLLDDGFDLFIKDLFEDENENDEEVVRGASRPGKQANRQTIV